MAVQSGYIIEKKIRDRRNKSIRLRSSVDTLLKDMCEQSQLSENALIHDAIEHYYKTFY